jgi:hypothetical protein
MDRLLTVTVQGQTIPPPVEPGRVRELVERYRREGVEPRIDIEARHGSSHIRFVIPPPSSSGRGRPLDTWENEAVELWNHFDLNANPVDLHQLVAFIARMRTLL